MMNTSLVRLAALNATRKPARTLLTAGMVVAAVALLIISMSWLDGIWGTMLGGSTDMIGHVEVAQSAWADNAGEPWNATSEPLVIEVCPVND